VPITVVRGDGARQVVGESMPFVDRKNNLRIQGMWASTPLGEYVRTLVAQRVLRDARLDYTDTIDDDGVLVREVLGGVFTLPADPPPGAPTADQAGLPTDPAAELLGLAARIYTARADDVAGLADQAIALLVELSGTAPEP
jgi:hypothetical protein